MVVTPANRFYRVPYHLPPNEMKAFYESAIEPECPRPAYDPDMDIPEPPAPRRKPPFETVKTKRGMTHRFKSFTVFTGYCEGGKWAAITIQEPTWQPLVMCDRPNIAHLLRHNRKAKPC
jgi:hypothetical protein